MHLSLPQARRIALHQQFYRFGHLHGKTGVLEVIRNLSYLQIDTISVVQRAHHHTLYNRVQGYQPHWLDELLAKDKAIFEHWGHAASYLPMDDYAFYKMRMQNFPSGSWEKKFWELHKDLANPILKRIRKEGPLSTKDFKDTRLEKTKEPWGNLKPAKIMLELLMWKGDLIVTARDKFQRVYDLTERVIPHYKSIAIPSEQERAEFMVLRTLQSHGIATQWDIINHISLAPKPAVSMALQKLLKLGTVRSVVLESCKETFYCPAELDVGSILNAPQNNQVRILSPFDNAVILRPRLNCLFRFEYALECYVTPAKRKFGYWNCPILWQDELVGMLDPKADRKNHTLLINSLYIKSRFWKSSRFQTAFGQALSDFAVFNGCDQSVLDKINLL
jgi:uncharacterized protein YcaQ